jgi:hypothetical protein
MLVEPVVDLPEPALLPGADRDLGVLAGVAVKRALDEGVTGVVQGKVAVHEA